MSPLEQELLTRREHLSAHLSFSEVRVTYVFVLCVVLSFIVCFCSFSFSLYLSVDLRLFFITIWYFKEFRIIAEFLGLLSHM